MPVKTTFCTALLSFVLATALCSAEEVLFEDAFENGLSDKWQIVGLAEKDYRIRDGALELRVHPGELTSKTPMLKVVVPFKSGDTVTVSVKVTILDAFTEPNELAGVFLLDEKGWEFAAKKQRVGGKLVFAPGKYEFQGRPGEEGDVDKYVVRYTAATDDAGPLRILVRGGRFAYFRVGPSEKGGYRTFFHSAIRQNTKERGFGLTAAGAPDNVAHWVRFDDFRVVR